MKSLYELYESIIDNDEEIVRKSKIATAYQYITKAFVEILHIAPNKKYGEDPTKVKYITPLYLSLDGYDEITDTNNKLLEIIIKRNSQFKKELKTHGIHVGIEKKSKNSVEGWKDVTFNYSFYMESKRVYLGFAYIKLSRRIDDDQYVFVCLHCYPSGSIERNEIYNAIYDAAGVKH